MCGVLFFQLCQVNVRPEVAVIYSPGWCASQILPSSCCHSFSSTQFYKVLQRRERSQNTPQSCSEPFLPCFLLYRHLYSSLYKSFHFLQQPDSISDLFSVNYCHVIFQLFSYHNFLLLNSLNVLSTVNEKNSKQLLDSLSPAVCCLFYFIELLLLVSLKMIHWESLCRRISEPVLHPRFQDYELSENSGACTSLSLNFMCGVSPLTQSKAFPHNKAALFFHLFHLWNSIPVLSVAGVWPQALWPPHPAAFTFCFLILLN